MVVVDVRVCGQSAKGDVRLSPWSRADRRDAQVDFSSRRLELNFDVLVSPKLKLWIEATTCFSSTCHSGIVILFFSAKMKPSDLYLT